MQAPARRSRRPPRTDRGGARRCSAGARSRTPASPRSVRSIAPIASRGSAALSSPEPPSSSTTPAITPSAASRVSRGCAPSPDRGRKARGRHCRALLLPLLLGQLLQQRISHSREQGPGYRQCIHRTGRAHVERDGGTCRCASTVVPAVHVQAKAVLKQQLEVAA